MKIKTNLAQLTANFGSISVREISEWTGIDERQLRELMNGEARAIELATLARLCTFFQCTPNDFFRLDLEEEDIDTAPPGAEALTRAREIVKQAFARTEKMPPRPAEEIWADFQAVRARVGAEMVASKSGDRREIEPNETDA